MFHRVNHVLVAAIVIGLVLVAAGGCGKGRFELDKLGVSMKLPPGWSQGEPLASGGYRAAWQGEFFFENADQDDPSGEVMEFPLEGASLTEHVDKLLSDTAKMEAAMQGAARALDKLTGGARGEELKQAEAAMQTKVLSKRPWKVSGLEAVEVVTEAPRTTLTFYVRRGDKVLAVTFGALKEEFPKYEKLFRASVATVRIR